MKTQKLYQEAIKFAAAKHAEQDQKVPGTNLPYVVHLSSVAMEIMIASCETDHFDLDFALQVALLNDTLEDTDTKFEELEAHFGLDVAQAVAALTKDKNLSKREQMLDSLSRIRKLQKEVWTVKIADRITNLQPPPAHWDNNKKIKYQEEAQIILNELKEGNEFLASRLEAKIAEYGNYIN